MSAKTERHKIFSGEAAKSKKMCEITFGFKNKEPATAIAQNALTSTAPAAASFASFILSFFSSVTALQVNSSAQLSASAVSTSPKVRKISAYPTSENP